MCPSRANQPFTSKYAALTPIVLNATTSVEEPGGEKLNSLFRQSCRPEVYVPQNWFLVFLLFDFDDHFLENCIYMCIAFLSL